MCFCHFWQLCHLLRLISSRITWPAFHWNLLHRNVKRVQNSVSRYICINKFQKHKTYNFWNLVNESGTKFIQIKSDNLLADCVREFACCCRTTNKHNVLFRSIFPSGNGSLAEFSHLSKWQPTTYFSKKKKMAKQWIMTKYEEKTFLWRIYSLHIDQSSLRFKIQIYRIHRVFFIFIFFARKIKSFWYFACVQICGV